MSVTKACGLYMTTSASLKAMSLVKKPNRRK